MQTPFNKPGKLNARANHFARLKNGQGLRNTKTGEMWQKSDTNQSGTAGFEWKVGRNGGEPTRSSKITVTPSGKVLKKDQNG